MSLGLVGDPSDIALSEVLESLVSSRMTLTPMPPWLATHGQQSLTLTDQSGTGPDGERNPLILWNLDVSILL